MVPPSLTMRKGRQLIALLGFGVIAAAGVRAQTQTAPHGQSARVQFGTSYHNDVSPSLRDLPAVGPEDRNDGAALRLLAPNAMPPPILTFDGIPFPVIPPNTDGAAGLTQYVQVVNQNYQVFDKETGVSIIGPIVVHSIWAGFGGLCENNGNGAPVVLYDHLADRWVIGLLAGAGVPTDVCMAVSTTSDATGTFYRYGFHLGSNFFDSPHFGAWSDGYYASVKVFNSGGLAFLGPQAFAFDRAKMLSGTAASYLTVGITGGASEPFFLPSDLDGAVPPSGTGNPFVSYPGSGNYNVRLFHADFVTPANTTFDLIGNPIAAGFTPLCPGITPCVPQLGGVQLDGLGNKLMMRLAYRKFSDHDAVVGNYSVNSNDVAGIRWFELRNVTAGPVTLFQEGTYQPDTTWRWTGSVAMDRLGNLALGFSASSSTQHPSIRYAGRLVSDPPGTLAQGEASLLEGTASQTSSSAWGRDSSMSIDPVDDCTFWYTNEYIGPGGGDGRTRIGKFKFAECTGGPTPTASPSPVSDPTPTPSPTTDGTPTATPPPPTPTATITPTPAPTPSQARALNISTRLRVGTGEGVMIGGFIVNGTEPKMVAIRGVGPSLGSSGLTGVLADPTLELRGSDGALIRQNDNWQDDSAQATQLSKLGLALQSPLESGIVATLQPGAYTAVLAGKDQTAGIGLVEIYDVDSVAASQLANLSTRGSVQTAEEVMIGGFILGNGVGNTDVVVRGIGPSLSQAGLSGVLADPILELRNGDGGLLLSNDNWQDDSVSAAQLTAHGLAPQNSMESGIFATLSPGAYTAILAGKNGGVGLGLIEIYHLGEAASPTPSPIPVQHPIVTTMSDSGAGSLREAIALVSDGGLIEFDAALNGGSIDLTSSELVIDKNITITGPGFELLTVSRDGNAATSFRIFHIRPNRIVTIQGLTISGGSAMGSDSTGGAIYNEPESSLLLMNCNLVNNHASSEFLVGGGSGGAITNHGILEIRNCNLNGNGASAFHSGSGGAVISDGTLAIVSSTLDANSAGVDGGAISNSGSASITASTISNNTAYGHPLTGGSGGGIVNSGPMTITNSTISGNVVGFGYGSGIVSAVGPLIVSHSTFSGNSFTDPVGSAGGIYLSSGTLEIEDTILNAGAISDNLVSNSGTVISNGYNLSSDDGGALLNGIGDQLNVDPMVGPLQDNGGPTLTHALLPGSPAINAGDPNFTPPPLFDQRGEGYDRNSDGRIDIGSFEVQTVR